MGKICDYKDITIEGGCKGTAHATTPQMAAGASQTLYITGGSEGDTYYWATTSGSLSSPTGTSVTYTAPATNPNCVNNPTITVTCGGATIGTLTIAVNAIAGNSVAKIWHYGGITKACWCNGIVPGRICYAESSGYRLVVNCDNSGLPYNTTVQGSSTDQGDESVACAAAEAMSKSGLGIALEKEANPWDTPIDYRDAAQKAQGCCPALLL